MSSKFSKLSRKDKFILVTLMISSSTSVEFAEGFLETMTQGTLDDLGLGLTFPKEGAFSESERGKLTGEIISEIYAKLEDQ